MIIKRIRVTHIRNLNQVTLQNISRVNVITGLNGSGKSSLLEAIHILSTGKSFRTSQLKQYIRHEQTSAVVYAETDTHTIAIQKFADGKNLIKLDGVSIASFSQAAKILPVILIDPAMLTVLEEGSAARRALFDWAVFHVEPLFYETWIQYQRALKQRNKLLKEKKYESMDYWEQQLAQLTVKLNKQRKVIFTQFKPLLESYIEQLIPDGGMAVSAKLSMGTPTAIAPTENEIEAVSQLVQHYAEHRRQDQERGYTYYGAHRADIRLMSKLGAVEGIYSRGQKKLLIVAFKLAQSHLLQQAGKKSVLLLDDVISELDQQAFNRLLMLLKAQQAHIQLFITLLPHQLPFVEKALEQGLMDDDLKLFHVEQGEIKN